MNAERLLNVARALRESKRPGDFDMYRYVHACGTPSCAFGHYAAREDLQDEFRIFATENRCEGIALREARPQLESGYPSESVLKHFGITRDEADELFGCDEDYWEENDPDKYALLARTCSTALEAAIYIENFVKEHSNEQT